MFAERAQFGILINSKFHAQLSFVAKNFRSRDVNSDLLVDKLTGSNSQIYIHKRKIVWGEDGEYFDVTLETPFPIQGSFSSAPVRWQNFGQSTPKKVPVDDNSTVLLEANPNRVFVRIINNTGRRIYIQYGIDAEYGSGTPLGTNGILNITTVDLFTGQINAITDDSIAVNIEVIEGEI